MARQEQEREDLLREATGLVRRAELCCGRFAEPVVVGFRRDGSGSIFLGADPVYQFNAGGQLRRAYKDGLLIKAERGKLASLDRQRRQRQVQLLRRDLDESATAALLAEISATLAALHRDLCEDSFTVSGQVPDDGNLVAEIIAWLESLPVTIEIAQRPNVARAKNI